MASVAKRFRPDDGAQKRGHERTDLAVGERPFDGTCQGKDALKGKGFGARIAATVSPVAGFVAAVLS